VVAVGSNGAPSVDLACTIEQEYDRHRLVGGGAFLGIWGRRTLPSDPTIAVGFAHRGAPAVGIQPSGTFSGIATVTSGTSVWRTEEALSFASPGPSAFVVRLTTVRAVRDAGTAAYELHGTVDVRLIPTVRGSAAGWIDLHVDF